MKKIFLITVIFLISMLFYEPKDNETIVIKPQLCVVEIKGEVMRPRNYEVPLNTSYLEASSLAGLTEYSVVLNENKKIDKNTTILVEKRVGNTNINTASLKELESLPGVGKLKAEKIIEYRQRKKITSWDEFKYVTNIKDEKTMVNIKLQAFIR